MMEDSAQTMRRPGRLAAFVAWIDARFPMSKMWKEHADVPHPLFYGYTFSSGGTWAGYIPDLRSAAYGGYGADASTRIEVGAGEKIILRHLTFLYELLGMWLDKPGRS